MRFRRASPNAPAQPPRSLTTRLLPTALAGALSVFSFAPFGWWPLQIASLAVLFYQMLRGASVKSGFFIGWAYGFGWVCAGTWWLYVSLHNFGEMAAPLAGAAVVLLALGMGLYVALAMAAAAWLRRRWLLSLPAMNLIVLPLCWGLSEWVRGWLFTGFPWIVSGYAHTASPLAGYAPLLGVYGLGWLAALAAGALLLLVHRTRKVALAVLVLLFGAGFGLEQVVWTHPEGKPISVRLVQGNVPQQEKFSREFLAGALAAYQADIMAKPADLIATPETAFPMLPQQLPPGYLEQLGKFAVSSHSHLLLGMPLADSATAYYNSTMGIPPVAGSSYYRYDKHHLVPFGEFIPPGFHWFVDLVAIPLGDMTRGAVVQPAFSVGQQRVLPNICYEDLFGEEIAAQLATPAAGQQPATILLNISNLAWFGDTIAIPQHLQISQMRTLETGRPMLRATNTGATAIISSRGVVVGLLPTDSHGTLAADVQGFSGMTPYILLGNKLFLALSVLLLAGTILLARKKNGQLPEESQAAVKTR